MEMLSKQDSQASNDMNGKNENSAYYYMGDDEKAKVDHWARRLGCWILEVQLRCANECRTGDVTADDAPLDRLVAPPPPLPPPRVPHVQKVAKAPVPPAAKPSAPPTVQAPKEPKPKRAKEAKAKATAAAKKHAGKRRLVPPAKAPTGWWAKLFWLLSGNREKDKEM